MNGPKLYTLDELQTLIANLDNCTSELRDESMSRVKLPIPQEYGGGWATGRTQEEAVRNLLKRVGDLRKTDTDSPTFKDCWEQWISIKMGGKLAATTIACYKGIAEKHLLPFFGGKLISDITPDDIQMFYNSIMDLSGSVSTQCKAILCGIFDRAVRLGQIEKNIMLYKYDRSKKKGEKVILQDKDLIKVIKQSEELEGLDYLYFSFLCFTSLRRGEILGLKWQDIDFEKGIIRVVNNVTFPNGSNNAILTAPKDGSRGIVHLSSELRRRIEDFKQKFGFVLPYSAKERNKPMTKSMFTKMWARIKKKVDLKGATSHCFRATYATMMNAHCNHIDPKVIQGALRHKTPDLAMRVYTQENGSKTRLAEVEYAQWLKTQLKQSSL